MESAIGKKSAPNLFQPKNSHWKDLAFLTALWEWILLVLYNPLVKFMHEKCYIFVKRKKKVHPFTKPVLVNSKWFQNYKRQASYSISFKSVLHVILWIFESILIQLILKATWSCLLYVHYRDWRENSKWRTVFVD